MGVRLDLLHQVTDDELLRLSRRNPVWQFERNAEGELVMSPAGGESGYRSAEVLLQLGVWNRRHGLGVMFDSSTGFNLPDGSCLSPDAAWVYHGAHAPGARSGNQLREGGRIQTGERKIAAHDAHVQDLCVLAQRRRDVVDPQVGVGPERMDVPAVLAGHGQDDGLRRGTLVRASNGVGAHTLAAQVP